jgi:hypothetical protein
MTKDGAVPASGVSLRRPCSSSMACLGKHSRFTGQPKRWLEATAQQCV